MLCDQQCILITGGKQKRSFVPHRQSHQARIDCPIVDFFELLESRNEPAVLDGAVGIGRRDYDLQPSPP
jgi:hypothetical protein